MSNILVDSLGALAGIIWVSSAIYYQMVHPHRIPVKYIATLFGVGAGLLLVSSAVSVSAGPRTSIALGIIGNLLFLLLGIGISIHLRNEVQGDDAEDYLPTH